MFRFLALLTLAGALLATPASAQPKPPGNDDCLACHGESDARRSNGTSVAVSADAFHTSVHGQFNCVDCHTDLATLTEFPHPDTLAPVNCAMCHEEPGSQLASSVHTRRPHGGGPALKCTDCHGNAHQILPASDAASATNKLRIAMTCGHCHGDTPNPPSGMRGPAVARMFADSIHGQALSRDGLVVAPTCSDCHTAHAVMEHTSDKSPVFRANVPATCGKCHAGIQRDYEQGVHAAALKAGNAKAPECANCHTAHSIARTESDAWQLSAVQQCGTCHAQALATYRDTFHGQVTRLGFVPVAKCVDCHQTHHIFKPEDPRSSVNQANLVSTCRKCHAQANANFVKYQPHANQHDKARLPQLYYSARFMDYLLLGVFAFFGIHTTLWFVRERTGGKDDGRGDRRG